MNNKEGSTKIHPLERKTLRLYEPESNIAELADSMARTQLTHHGVGRKSERCQCATLPELRRPDPGRACLQLPWGHPLAGPVNRDERDTATGPRILLFPKPVFPVVADHRALGSRILVAPLRTSHPSGSRPATPCGAFGPWLRLQPQKTLCSPPRPINAADFAGRTGLWLRSAGCPALAIQPLVAHGTGATNSSTWAGSAAACNQVSWFCQPQSDTAAAVPLI